MTTLNDDHPIFDALLEETGVDSRKTVFREKHHDGADVQNRAEHSEWLNDFTVRANRKVAEDSDNLAKDLAEGGGMLHGVNRLKHIPKDNVTPINKPTPAKAAKKAVPAQRTNPEESK